MPPQLSDDSSPDPSSATMVVKGPSPEDDAEELKVQSDEDDDAAETSGKRSGKTTAAREGSEDDSSGDESELYIVEKIKAHTWDVDAEAPKFFVKWEGYSAKKDMTWESEDNLASAPDVLNTYIDSIGGRDAFNESIEQQRAEFARQKELLQTEGGKNGKKRGRSDSSHGVEVASAAAANGSANKRGRKSAGGRESNHPADSTPPASMTTKKFQPPKDWEAEVMAIDACEEDGKVQVFLTWRAGQKTKHDLEVVYKKCPQKMLKFYEKHLVFKHSDGNDHGME